MDERAHLLTARIREEMHQLCALPIDDGIKIDAMLEIERTAEEEVERLLPEDDEPVDRGNG